jgi:hypothetical protein
VPIRLGLSPVSCEIQKSHRQTRFITRSSAFDKERSPGGGPSGIWVHNPKLVKASAPLGAHFHPGGYSLSEREREIAVIIINSKWHSAYPTNAHERRGKEVGLPLRKGRGDAVRPADLVRGRARADRLRDGDLSR